MKSIYQKTLNPNFWEDKTFSPEIRSKILHIVSDFIREIKLEAPIKDITLTGSLANFNYNKYSDLDVHIILNFSKVDKNEQLVRDALDGKRFVWNLRHNIFLKDHEVELYFQDYRDPHHATAIFSVLRNKWLKEPVYNPPQGVNMEEVEKKAYYIKDTIDRMLRALETTADKEEIKLINQKAKSIKDRIIKIRKEALAQKGEFAFENLVFKKLRNEGTIEDIIKIINASYDKMFMESKFMTGIREFLKKHL